MNTNEMTETQLVKMIRNSSDPQEAFIIAFAVIKAFLNPEVANQCIKLFDSGDKNGALKLCGIETEKNPL